MPMNIPVASQAHWLPVSRRAFKCELYSPERTFAPLLLHCQKPTNCIGRK